MQSWLTKSILHVRLMHAISRNLHMDTFCERSHVTARRDCSDRLTAFWRMPSRDKGCLRMIRGRSL
jgi:hypothetical protein